MDTQRRAASALSSAGRLTLVTAALLAAAVPLSAQSGSEDETVTAPRPWETPAKLRVQSNNWLDLHLYVVRDGFARSLGVVNGPGLEVLTLPSEATLPGSLVQILVEPIGGGESYLSDALAINPGDRVELTVQNNLALSSESLARW